MRTAWPVRADFNERHCGGCQNGDVRETGLLVEVPEAAHLVASWRARYDPVTTRGIPAHVTALWPFVAPEEIDAAVIDGLRAALRTVEPFEFELDHVNEFPGVVWLHPEPDVPFRSLTRAIWMAFPDYPPYRGAFPDSSRTSPSGWPTRMPHSRPCCASWTPPLRDTSLFEAASPPCQCSRPTVTASGPESSPCRWAPSLRMRVADCSGAECDP